ncbi:MAG: hypothetical protein RIT24_244 [Planctomycetota bacterium]|jgi:hypothetical protein
MPLTPDEAVGLALELADLISFVDAALKPDDTGVKRLNPAEARELLRRLSRLTAKVAVDVLD